MVAHAVAPVRVDDQFGAWRLARQEFLMACGDDGVASPTDDEQRVRDQLRCVLEGELGGSGKRLLLASGTGTMPEGGPGLRGQIVPVQVEAVRPGQGDGCRYPLLVGGAARGEVAAK